MDPMTLMALGAIGAPVIGGIMGQQEAAKDRRLQERIMRDTIGRFEALDTPTYESLGPVDLQNLDSLQQYSPEIADLVQLQGSQMAGISLDPNLRAAQMQALEQLGELSQSGMTDVDRARLAQIQAQTDTAARGQREAISQNMQARGISGSGLELMAQLQGQQGAAQQANMGGLQTAADAQMRALEALYNRAGLAGSMEQADFGRQAQTAQAQDAIARMNADFRMQHGQQRADTLNDAQLRNQALQAQQVDARNRINMFNQFERPQANMNMQTQDFQNRLGKTAGATGQMTGLAGMYGQSAQSKADTYSGIGQGVAQGFATYAANRPRDQQQNPQYGRP